MGRRRHGAAPGCLPAIHGAPVTCGLVWSLCPWGLSGRVLLEVRGTGDLPGGSLLGLSLESCRGLHSRSDSYGRDECGRGHGFGAVGDREGKEGRVRWWG